MANQVINGKAFEYALLMQFFEKLNPLTKVSIVENTSFNIAAGYFDSFTEKEKSHFTLVASFAINFLLDLEPRLSNGIDLTDQLQLELVSDKSGQNGDVRDVLAIRLLQKWEIGISAKNNHRAIKHPRLSQKIDFGLQWLGVGCSKQYFKEIEPIFTYLSKVRSASSKKEVWSSLGDYQTSIYLPLLEAFKNELLRLTLSAPEKVAHNLVSYLIGNKDFYKVIKSNEKVEIQAYNLHGTLNQPYSNIKPKAKVPQLKFPTRLIDIVYQENSKSTLLVTLNEGWQISFRIHNASSRVEPSLKFDVNLVSSPHSLFSNHLFL